MVVRLNRVKNKLVPLLKPLSLALLVGASALEAAQYARKTAAALGTAAYWGLTLSQPVEMLRELHAKKTLEENFKESRYDLLKKIAPNVVGFAEKELTALGLPDARVVPHLLASAALYKDIMIHTDLLDEVEASLKNVLVAQQKQEEPAEVDLATIRRLKGVLHHEAQHIKNGDISWRLLALSVASAAIPVGARIAWRAARPAVDQAKRLPNIRKILSGWVNLAVSGQVYNAGSRAIEQQADDAINNREAMEGVSAFLQKEHDRLRIAMRITDCPVIFSDEAQQKSYENFLQKLNDYDLWRHEHISSHPSPMSRIEKLQSRLQEK